MTGCARCSREEGVDANDDALLLIARQADGGMRDALSVLDQCLSFGEGPLSVERVRDVLGLVDDESFGAILDLVAARDPGQVFGVVERLIDAGADLVEVAGGLAELLRAVLIRQYGATPSVLPESTLQLVERSASALASEDVVRMLKLLGEAETPLRRSANPRLVLETLLLRWAMMDRAADLKALLGGRAPEPAGSPAPYTSPPQATIPPPQPATPSAADADAAATPAFSVPWTDEAIAAAWPDIVETARRQGRFLGQALEQAIPRVAEPGVLGLVFGADQAVAREGVERQLETVGTIISARLGTTVKVTLSSEAVAGRRGPAKQSGRLTVEEIRRERLADLRRRDPALDAAADALDLELVDDE